MNRVREYEQYELVLANMIQRACAVSYEKVNYILNEFKGVSVNRELERFVIPPMYDASKELAQLCYSIVRLTKPSLIVETGVGRGITSFYILRALEKNGKGSLHSIELPPLELGSKQEVGCFVPISLRSNWNLIFGPGVSEMNKLKRKLYKIDIFVHDSNHNYNNQLAEYKIALDWLKPGGILISDDVGNNALLEVNDKIDGTLMVARQSKPLYIGIIVK